MVLSEVQPQIKNWISIWVVKIFSRFWP